MRHLVLPTQGPTHHLLTMCCPARSSEPDRRPRRFHHQQVPMPGVCLSYHAQGEDAKGISAMRCCRKVSGKINVLRRVPVPKHPPPHPTLVPVCRHGCNPTPRGPSPNNQSCASTGLAGACCRQACFFLACTPTQSCERGDYGSPPDTTNTYTPDPASSIFARIHRHGQPIAVGTMREPGGQQQAGGGWHGVSVGAPSTFRSLAWQPSHKFFGPGVP